MKLEISENTLSTINIQLKNILMGQNRLLYIESFKTITEDVKVEPFWGKSRIVKKTYLTEIKIVGYNPNGDFIGYYSDETCEQIIGYYDLHKMRKNWIEFRNQLKAFGVDVLKIKELDKVN